MTNNTIDLDILDELKEIMEADFSELITVFITDAKILIDDLKQAIEASNASDIRKIAHTLKGSSANLGANKLSEVSKVLETNAANNLLTDAGEIFAQINNEYDSVKKALEVYS